MERPRHHFLPATPTLRGLVAVLFISAIEAPAKAETLVVQGSTTFYSELMQPHQAAIEARAMHKLTLITNKSSLGILALFERRADIAMISTSLESEVVALRRTNPSLGYEKLRNFDVTRTRVALAVHPKNPVRSASLAKIRQILLGEITNWQQLSGTDTPIRLVLVRGGGGVTTSVESELLAGRSISTARAIFVQSGSQVVQVVAEETGAIGLAQLGLLRKLNLPELVTDHLVEQQLNLVTLGEPTPAMRAIIDAARTVATAQDKEIK